MKLDRTIPKELLEQMEKLAGNDMRVGQMFINVFTMIEKDGKSPFNIENDELVKYFKRLVK